MQTVILAATKKSVEYEIRSNKSVERRCLCPINKRPSDHGSFRGCGKEGGTS